MTSSGYGTTGQSRVMRSVSFDLHDEGGQDEDEYDYLPMPDVDEDYLNLGDSVNQVVQRRIPFSHIHHPPLPFDAGNRLCFMTGQKISVEIVSVDQSDHSQILNPNLYAIQVSHGDYKWTVKRRYKHFRSLHDSLYLFKTRTMLPLPTKEARELRKSFAKTKDLTRFPKRPEALVRSDDLEERKILLEAYLQSVLRCPQYRNHPETLKFLEVSNLSFINGLGDKYKEGIVEKRAGGRRISLHCCSCFSCCSLGHWQERWLILKDTFVAYLRPSDGTISDVLLMDRDFGVKYGLFDTGLTHGLLISNLSRRLLVKCWTQRKAHEWHDDIRRASVEKGKEYTQLNRFDSFVPMRPNSYVNWFVDGASYMAAVADALEAAKEEIFITDWMLSPELHLKRPMIDGDRWRLDKILERKAAEGVKIFILIYKEMEMALGINSFYTKHTLMDRHDNIKVMRHPDGIKLWSHHEKCVVIDQRLAFLGGIDLCYGRWDTRKHRLTDLGTVSLSNIFGNQDSETLDNLLNNIPNIVPKKDALVSPCVPENKLPGMSSTSCSSSDPASRPSCLEPIQEIDPKQVNIQMHSRDCDSNGTSQGNNKMNKEMTTSRSLDVVRDKSGGYSNPGLSKDSPGSVKGFQMCTYSEEPSVRKRTAASGDAFSTDIQVHNRCPSGERKIYSSLSTDSSKNVRLIRQKALSDSDFPAVNTFEPQTNRLSHAASEISLGLTDNTLQTYLKNMSERNAEIAARLESERMGSSSNVAAFNLQEPTDNNTRNGVKPSGHLREAFVRFGRRQTYNVGTGGAPKAELPKDVVDVKQDTVDDELTVRQLVEAISASDQNNEKPATPKAKRNLKWKNVIQTKLMFQKQMSVDVSNDDALRPWNESVFLAKECDTTDGEIDDQLSKRQSGATLKIWVGKDYVNFIRKDFVELDNPFTDMIDRKDTPRMPWHDIGVAVFGKPARDVARHFIQRWNFTKLQKRKTIVGIPMLLPKSSTKVSVPKWATNSAFCCNCQILRSACEWSAGIKLVESSIHNAYTELILNAKHYIYIENQFFISITKDKVVQNQLATALYERILMAHRSSTTFRIYVILPLLPAFEGQLGTSTGTSIQAVIHWNYASICRGGNSLLERLIQAGVHDPFEYISFYGLRKHEEMLGTLTSELVYVHSKLMIVDDFSVIIGSANINDRSFLGNRDSELAILVQDTRCVSSHMNGEPFKAGTFACSLRKSLFREHLGIQKDNSSIDVSDPISSEFYKNVWLKQASINTSIYEKVFGCIPSDAVMTIQQLIEFQKKPKLAETRPDEARIHLKRVLGHLVLLPLQFLANESLTPATGTKEALVPTVIWT